MIEKNKEYILDIISQGYEGEGVAKIDDNFPIFVEGALAGEKVKVIIVKAKKKFAYGKIVEIIEKSPNRVDMKCEHRVSGGCNLQHYSYEAQLDFKYDRVKECIRRIGKLDDSIVKLPIGMENPDKYRNKVQLPIGIRNGKLSIGFFAARSHEIMDMESCIIQDEVADKVISLTRNWIKEHNIKPYNIEGEYDESGILRHIMVRRGFKTNEVMVVIVTNGRKLPHAEEFIKTITENVEGIKSVVQNINSEKTNVILGQENITLWGEDTISDYIGEFKFNISPESFFQVNPAQTEVLYGKALEYANLAGEETVIDAYCGTGTITLFLSKNAKKVYGVELIEKAIENAKENAQINNVDNVEFIIGESEVAIPQLINDGIRADVIMLDPPRRGCDVMLLNAITSTDVKRIVYVSCDPSTLSRDLAILDERGYKAVEVQPVDMFPHTPHIESVVLLEKK
ncbi:23S rRNA (uracil(1939)-C(5))-methyltransferase RlmD [uncultured Clostridium sp.]|uniref:23S rRNA (uracil(1939)-C(5))-methyltransferase RlmD n=1 Tax=uncultured Clostridium sp. TaxID=59620 RepID=UPI00261255C0|nr:23S rRNA (uracil(1939)-C(5))-methyltransferase RlmD [uncultured Clostridium sp.]